MADVVIFVPCFDRSSPRHVVNYGALAVVTALRRRGIDAVYVDGADGPLEQVCRCMEEQLEGCAFFGVSAFTAQVGEGIQACEFVRHVRPDLPIVWGGIHATMLPEETARCKWVDYVCVGEGDYAAIDLYEQFASGAPDMDKARNLVYEVDGEAIHTARAPFYDMAEQEQLAWDALDVEKYVVHNRYDGDCPSLGVPVARGCPHRCSFCINVAFGDYGYTRYRRRRPEHVAADVSYLKERVGIGFSFIRDEVSFVDLDYSTRIAEVMHEQGVLWGANLRASYFTPKRLTVEYLRGMRELGMLNGAMGVESGSPRVLKEIVRKDITLPQVEHAMEVMSQAGIRPFVSYVVGFPTETPAEMRQTLDLAVRLKRRHPRTVVAGVYLLRPYPGAPIFPACVEHGLRVPRSLEEWATAGMTRQGGFPTQDMPWLKGRQNLYARLEYTTASLMDVERAAGFALNVFILMAKLRQRAGFYALPWELWIFKYVRAAVHALQRRLARPPARNPA